MQRARERDRDGDGESDADQKPMSFLAEKFRISGPPGEVGDPFPY